ncbi:MAG: hypothetical protein D4R44_04045 [Actinobacteria bacterium]|nr:MAG: hypothetical protein D4R44_04045 [Actinomycetota bacterium]
MLLRRTHFNSDGILGVLLDAYNDQLAVTLEHSYEGKPKLPAGVYQCQRGMHRLHTNPNQSFETFEVLKVPGHDGILFHAGNWQKDSDGCILLGRVCTNSSEGCMITQSQVTFARFMEEMAGIDSFELTVEDGVPA